MSILYVRRASLIGVLVGAGAASGWLHSALTVLSKPVVDDLRLTRSELGIAFLAISITGALASPAMGRLSDHSARQAIMALFGTAAAAIVFAATVPSLVWLLLAALLGGLALAASNPVTNTLVARHIPAPQQGVVIGVKQAGSSLSLVLAGLVLPSAASIIGWRWAMALSALLLLGGFAAAATAIPASDGKLLQGEAPASLSRDLRGAVTWLAGMSLLVAVGVGAVVAFLPLYAQEALGLVPAHAGALAALLGITALAGRIAWGLAASRYNDTILLLAFLAALAVIATTLIWRSDVTPIMVWLGAPLAGISMLAWHAVGWLALVRAADGGAVGRASGMVQLANLVGFAAGAPIFGVLVDIASYRWAWAFVAILEALTLAITLTWRWLATQSNRGRTGP